ncbi:tRNA lysidine(34) synthetase TilS [Ruminococcus sp. HUN007]|uniref:tRNA lysidine(34) synthetase TilS n=1 Tax=Ruminococcus sp. HUN007 TaxID=1514668 RepID=UPI000679000A|nr:tRNA lysidine(34) synthetase TilS [Ruminococcus sp. HUN007]
MLGRILSDIEKFRMTEKNDHIVAALSGGADSVCLLLALSELQDQLGITLSAIHVNHCLRGEESDRDEKFCRDLCQRLSVPFICGRFDVNAEAAKMKMSTELAAREIRYRFFAEQTAGKKLATAHNANDNAETVIFNLTRGTGTKGIAGIPPVRDNIIRPLLGVTRNEIEAFLKERKQDFVTDSTNLSDDYTRNTIRHNVIPVLEKINPALFRTISADSDNFRTDSSFIESEAEKAYSRFSENGNTLRGISELHPAVRRRCIARLLTENHIEVNAGRIADMEKAALTGGKINLKGDIYAEAADDVLRITVIPKKPVSAGNVCIRAAQGENTFLNKKVYITYADINQYEKDGFPPCTAMIDADCITGDLVLRNRMPGDRIKLENRNFTSSVKKLLNSLTEPEERDSLCFAADDSGILFIEKAGIADRARITNSTKKNIDDKSSL